MHLNNIPIIPENAAANHKISYNTNMKYFERKINLKARTKIFRAFSIFFYSVYNQRRHLFLFAVYMPVVNPLFDIKYRFQHIELFFYFTH